jgi:hypothetical protein
VTDLGDTYEIPEVMLDFNDPNISQCHTRTGQAHTVTIIGITYQRSEPGEPVAPNLLGVRCSCGAEWAFTEDGQ